MLDFSRISQCKKLPVERINEQNRVMEKGEIVGLTIDGQFYNIQVGEKVRKDVPVNELRIADA